MKVLMVDDEQAFLEQAEIFLNNINGDMDVTIISDPKEALKKLEKSEYDVIVSDYQMPEMDGVEFLRILREEKDIPFIMFTGKGREAVAMKALNEGADRYIRKGGNPTSQFEVLAQAIEQEVNHYKTKNRNKDLLRDLEETFNTIRYPIFLLDDEHQILRTNDAAEDFFGRNRKELLGEFCHVVAHDQDEPIENCPLEESLETKRMEELEFYSEEMDRYFIARTNPILDEDGEIKKIVHQEIDITDLKKKEKELEENRRLFESIFNDPSMFVGILDLEGNLVRANRTALEFINKPMEEVKGRSFHETPWWSHSEDMQKKVRDSVDEVKEGNVVNFEATHQNGEGDEVKVDFSLRPILGDNDEVIKLLAYGKDVEYN